jgi:hypothetical protein
MLVVAIIISTAIHQANRSNPATNLVHTFCSYPFVRRGIGPPGPSSLASQTAPGSITMSDRRLRTYGKKANAPTPARTNGQQKARIEANPFAGDS